MAWGKAGSTTLGSNSAEINVTMTSSNFNQFMVNAIANGTVDAQMRLGYNSNDNTQKYSLRQSANGGADGSGSVGQTSIDVGIGGYDDDLFHVGYFANLSGEQKYFSGKLCHSQGTGQREIMREIVGAKWDNTNQANRIQYRESHSGTDTHITSDSNLSVIGSDLDIFVVQDGAIFYETDTNKSYVLYNGSWTEL